MLDGERGRGGGHRHGVGKPGKSEFPRRWSDPAVIGHVLDVARFPDEVTWQSRRGRWRVHGWRDDVDVVVIVDRNGDIRTSFPRPGGRGVVVNPVEGGDQA
ncbi:MAG: EndoU domain-containing protein [Micromonosporaceae bacterium]